MNTAALPNRPPAATGRTGHEIRGPSTVIASRWGDVGMGGRHHALTMPTAPCAQDLTTRWRRGCAEGGTGTVEPRARRGIVALPIAMTVRRFLREYASHLAPSTRARYADAVDMLETYLTSQAPPIRHWDQVTPLTWRGFLGDFYLHKVAASPTEAHRLLSAYRVLTRWVDKQYSVATYPTYAVVYEEYRRTLPKAIGAARRIAEWLTQQEWEKWLRHERQAQVESMHALLTFLNNRLGRPEDDNAAPTAAGLAPQDRDLLIRMLRAVLSGSPAGAPDRIDLPASRPPASNARASVLQGLWQVREVRDGALVLEALDVEEVVEAGEGNELAEREREAPPGCPGREHGEAGTRTNDGAAVLDERGTPPSDDSQTAVRAAGGAPGTDPTDRSRVTVDMPTEIAALFEPGFTLVATLSCTGERGRLVGVGPVYPD